MISQLVADNAYTCMIMFTMGLVLGILLGALLTTTHHLERRRK